MEPNVYAGVDARTAQLKQEVAAGARLVVYQWAFSVLVMSFKRPSGVKLIRPGQGRFWAGLPYTLLTLVVGWWGIPWGPVWTVQSVLRNSRGGIDVTAAVMRPNRAQALAPICPYCSAPLAMGQPACGRCGLPINWQAQGTPQLPLTPASPQ